MSNIFFASTIYIAHEYIVRTSTAWVNIYCWIYCRAYIFVARGIVLLSIYILSLHTYFFVVYIYFFVACISFLLNTYILLLHMNMSFVEFCYQKTTIALQINADRGKKEELYLPKIAQTSEQYLPGLHFNGTCLRLWTFQSNSKKLIS